MWLADPMSGRGGRPGKGQRDQHTVRPPLEFGQEIRERAVADGYDISDWYVLLAARELGREQYAPAPKSAHPELPLDLERSQHLAQSA